MKASEVLQKYAAGERDFRGLNLVGQQFKNQDLSGADFSETDIRGANFTKANLQGASFRRAKAGLQTFWIVALVIVSILLALIKIALLAFEEACLENTNLTRVNALGANFQRANLTGAILEDWLVNNNTQIENVICDYVYLRHNQDNQLERFPQDPNKNFAPGEFTQYGN